MALRILVVDDIKANISALESALKTEGNDFIVATSGIEALRLLSADTEIDLALIDVQMPDMDGFQLARLMKGVEKTRQIPIIFVTAQGQSNAIEFQGSDAGAIDFIFKPVNVQMLRSKIEVFERLKKKRLALSQKIHELQKAKADLEKSEKKAIEADRLKSVFLAHLSHEIRTPITALIGFAELLTTSSSDPDAIKYGSIILRSGQHLLDLLNDALDLSKIEAGQLEISLEDVDVVPLVRQTLEFLSPIADKNRVALSLDFPERTGVVCRVDRVRLKQIITNIVGNAIKFSPGGRVSVSFEEYSDSGRDFAKILVSDNGRGIDAAHHQRLFQPFTQVLEHDAETTFKGTGLGLSLSRELARLIGGDLALEHSEPHVGSCFSVSVPMGTVVPSAQLTLAGPSALAQEVANARLDGVQILFADDSADNRMLLEHMMPQFGASIETVENGRQALDWIETRKAPDVILMDYRMPVLNGVDATRALRERGFARPVVLLTANALKAEKDLALAAGASAYVTKPIDWHHLVKVINQSLAGASDAISR